MAKLVDAVLELDLSEIKKLINDGIDANEIDEVGKTALMYCVSFQQKGKDYTTGIFEKIKDDDYPIYFIHKNGLPVNAKMEVIDGKEQIVINKKGLEKSAFIKSYYETYKNDIFDMLIEAGADVNMKSNTGATALMFASQGETPEFVQKLIDLGCDVNEKEARGGTPLCGSAFANKMELTEILLKNGADATVILNDGTTILELVQSNASDEIIELLKEHGAK